MCREAAARQSCGEQEGSESGEESGGKWGAGLGQSSGEFFQVLGLLRGGNKNKSSVLNLKKLTRKNFKISILKISVVISILISILISIKYITNKIIQLLEIIRKYKYLT
jgi:hypothetical protein